MIVAGILKNRIPEILQDIGWTISDLQRATNLSYPGIHPLAKTDANELPQKTQIGTLQIIAEALTDATGKNYTVVDLYIPDE